MGAACFCHSRPNGSIAVNRHRYHRVSTLYSQNNSVCYLVRNESGHNNMMKEVALQSDSQFSACVFERDCHQLQSVRDTKKVIELVDCEINLRRFWSRNAMARFVFPYYEQGNVQDYVTNAERYSINENVISRWSLALCVALESLHTVMPKAIAHRDVQPTKLLLTDNLESVVLTDLSSATEIKTITTADEAQKMQRECNSVCSPSFRAPELYEITVGSQITEKCDIWSLGCTMYAMAFRESPFNDVTSPPHSQNLDIPDDHPYSRDFINLILSMLLQAHHQRPSSQEIRDHMWDISRKQMTVNEFLAELEDEITLEEVLKEKRSEVNLSQILEEHQVK